MKDHMKAVVWPRNPMTEGAKTNFRYPIVGMLVTTHLIEGLDGPEFVIDEEFQGELAALLAKAVKRQSEIRLGSADDVLTSLQEI